MSLRFINISDILETASGLDIIYKKITTLRDILYSAYSSYSSGLEDRIVKRENIKKFIQEEDSLTDELIELEEEYSSSMIAVQKKFLRAVNITSSIIDIVDGKLVINARNSSSLGDLDDCLDKALLTIKCEYKQPQVPTRK
jgi:hypothetical protein